MFKVFRRGKSLDVKGSRNRCSVHRTRLKHNFVRGRYCRECDKDKRRVR